MKREVEQRETSGQEIADPQGGESSYFPFTGG